MRLFVFILSVIFGVTFLSLNNVNTTSATSVPQETALRKTVCSFADIKLPVPVSAGAWQITDFHTGEVLAAHQPDAVFPLASVVKLLTAHQVLQAIDSHDTTITLTHQDILTEGRAGNLVADEVYTAHELLFPLLLTSSNDAGAALSRTYPNLVSDMQNFAQTAGAINTAVADTTGLSYRNTTTAHDLSLILSALYRQSPHIFDITRTSQSISRYENGWVNNIPFRLLSGYQGGKQGYLPEAGQTGVAIFTTGSEVQITFGITILNSQSVATDMASLHQAVISSYACVEKE